MTTENEYLSERCALCKTPLNEIGEQERGMCLSCDKATEKISKDLKQQSLIDIVYKTIFLKVNKKLYLYRNEGRKKARTQACGIRSKGYTENL